MVMASVSPSLTHAMSVELTGPDLAALRKRAGVSLDTLRQQMTLSYGYLTSMEAGRFRLRPEYGRAYLTALQGILRARNERDQALVAELSPLVECEAQV